MALENALEKLLSKDRVEPRSRFVQNQKVGRVGQGEDQAELGGHALRERGDFLRQRQLKCRQHLACQIIVPTGIELAHKSKNLTDRHPAIHAMYFRNITDALTQRGAVLAGVLAKKSDLAGVGRR